MSPRALKVCSTPRCPNLTRSGRCDECDAKADRARGTAAERGYGYRWQKVIQPRFLRRHPICVLCGQPAEVADHYPTSRRDLVRQGVRDPDADHRLRALCTPCHSTETAKHQPGGWHGQQHGQG